MRKIFITITDERDDKLIKEVKTEKDQGNKAVSKSGLIGEGVDLILQKRAGNVLKLESEPTTDVKMKPVNIKKPFSWADMEG